MVLTNYSSCTCRSNENVCSSSEGKMKDKVKLNLSQRSMVFWLCPPSPLSVNVIILQVEKKNQPVNDQKIMKSPFP